MRLTTNKFLGVGIMCRFAEINFENLNSPRLIAKGAHVAADGRTCGQVSLQSDWPPAVLEALTKFLDTIEVHMLQQFYPGDQEGDEEKNFPAEPPQL